jgi:hypothetical protein
MAKLQHVNPEAPGKTPGPVDQSGRHVGPLGTDASPVEKRQGHERRAEQAALDVHQREKATHAPVSFASDEIVRPMPVGAREDAAPSG